MPAYIARLLPLSVTASARVMRGRLSVADVALYFGYWFSRMRA